MDSAATFGRQSRAFAHSVSSLPSLSTEAAQLLLARQIVGLGIDTLSPDSGDSDFTVHRLILGAGKSIIENVAHARLLGAQGGYVIILPMKIQGATEAPVRLVALVEEAVDGC